MIQIRSVNEIIKNEIREQIPLIFDMFSSLVSDLEFYSVACSLNLEDGCVYISLNTEFDFYRIMKLKNIDIKGLGGQELDMLRFNITDWNYQNIGVIHIIDLDHFYYHYNSHVERYNRYVIKHLNEIITEHISSYLPITDDFKPYYEVKGETFTQSIKRMKEIKL